MIPAKFKITLICILVAIFQSLFFELVDTNTAIIILITFNILLQLFLPNVQIFNTYYVPQSIEEIEKTEE
tara:strand:+ start:3396 stop:3605 length:210 start_codon:yes stop_codon:yes gene_type:complete